MNELNDDDDDDDDDDNDDHVFFSRNTNGDNYSYVQLAESSFAVRSLTRRLESLQASHSTALKDGRKWREKCRIVEKERDAVVRSIRELREREERRGNQTTMISDVKVQVERSDRRMRTTEKVRRKHRHKEDEEEEEGEEEVEEEEERLAVVVGQKEKEKRKSKKREPEKKERQRFAGDSARRAILNRKVRSLLS